MTKAIGCVSGGLDSTLAVCLMREQDIDVVALHVFHLWHGPPGDPEHVPEGVANLADRGVEIRTLDATQADLEMVREPRFGFGKNMNPCIDCRIWTLNEARRIMEAKGADFIFTGEVMGQRPMSQHRQALDTVERQAGVEDILLRPLCAKLLDPTRPEREGLVDRERLMGISGRSRKPQMELAARFGITDYPSPAGGCLVTDPGFSHRLADLMEHGELTAEDVELLKVGRHFRLGPATRVVIGRDHEENELIDGLLRGGDLKIVAAAMPGPLTLLRGTHTEDQRGLAAAMTLRYGKAKAGEVHPVRIEPFGGGEGWTVEVETAEPATCREHMLTLETGE